MHLVSQSTGDTRAIAAQLAEQFRTHLVGRSTALVVALEGELGAGKTTLAQGIARALGVREQLKSPTFNLAKEYHIPDTPYRLWHIDCYRLNDHRDLASLDMAHIWADPTALVLIEWAQRVAHALPRDHWEIHLTHAGNEKREIVVRTP